MTNSDTYIKFTNLKKSFGDIKAVKDLSLEVKKGEIVGLIGPDGGGKTTAMRIACGLMTPDSGSAQIMGYDCTSQTTEIKKRIGYMPQRFSLYPDLSIAENLRFFADLFDVPKAERVKREAELYAFSQLEPFKKRHAGRLSGGMKQKLALSCTLIHKPNALILDEPTTGVDPVSRKEFWKILRDLANDGIALLVSTPYMDEAELCDRISLMYEGKVIASGNTEAVCQEFSHRLLEVKSKDIIACKKLLEDLENVEVHRFGDRLHIVFEDQKTISDVRLILEYVHAEIEEIEPGIEDTFVDLLVNREVENV